MSAGRCSGCGKEDKSCKVIRSHIMTCPKYVELYRESPEKCMDPEDEYREYKAWLASPEGQEWNDARKKEVADGHKARNAVKQEQQAKRWAK